MTDMDLKTRQDVKTGKSTGNYFILSCGKTLNCITQFRESLHKQLPALKNVVNKVEDSDFILVFIPVVSRAGTDIETALQSLRSISDTKPAVVVVLHHTFDPDHVAPDSSRVIKRENAITVDLLFHEDQGLLQCTKNYQALPKVINFLKPLVHKETSEGIKMIKNPVDGNAPKNCENCRKMNELEKQTLQQKLQPVLLVKGVHDEIKFIPLESIGFQQSEMAHSGIGSVTITSKALQEFYLLVVPLETTETKWMMGEMEDFISENSRRINVIILIGTKEGLSEIQDIITNLKECGISCYHLNLQDYINRSHVLYMKDNKVKEYQEASSCGSENVLEVDLGQNNTDVEKNIADLGQKNTNLENTEGKEENKVNENQEASSYGSGILDEIESKFEIIKKNIVDKERENGKLKTDISNIEQAINEHDNKVDRIYEVLRIFKDFKEMTIEDFICFLQPKVNVINEIKENVKSLKREMSKINANCRVKNGGAEVNDLTNLLSDFERSISELKSTNIADLEQKKQELEKNNAYLEQKNTDLEKNIIYLEQKKQELEKNITDLGQNDTVLD